MEIKKFEYRRFHQDDLKLAILFAEESLIKKKTEIKIQKQKIRLLKQLCKFKSKLEVCDDRDFQERGSCLLQKVNNISKQLDELENETSR
jgi:hypothetical protein